jgi:hypothetical protein
VLGEIVLLDKSVGPDGFHQLVSAYGMAIVLNQQDERFKGLRRQGDGLTRAKKEAFTGLQPERSELVEGLALQ